MDNEIMLDLHVTPITPDFLNQLNIYRKVRKFRVKSMGIIGSSG